MAAILPFWLIQAVLLLGLAVSTAFYLIMWYSAREFFASSPEPQPADAHLPAVTILKPLKGLDVDLHENLATLCRQDYDRFQILFGVADPGDPAVAVVKQLQAEYPHLDLELVVDARVYGTNYKVSNLHNMYGHAKHDVIVLADSDIRVRPDHLRRLVPKLQDARVGLVTCLYRAVNRNGWPTSMEALFINTDFCANVLVARKVERPRYAFGATIALRRDVLEEIGGFLSFANYLADDYQIGHRVAERGYELVLCDQVVDTVIAVGGWRRLLQHQLRWARTFRICRPGGYFTSILSHGTLWAVANLLYNHCGRISSAAAVAVISLRYFTAGLLNWRFLRGETRLGEFLLLAPKDLFVSLVWFLAFSGNTVSWSGRKFRVVSGGE